MINVFEPHVGEEELRALAAVFSRETLNKPSRLFLTATD